MNIFEIPLYYISFSKKENLEHVLNKVGFKNINLFNAVNGKELNIDDLINNNKISVRTYNDIVTKARHEHSGMTSVAAIGCYISHCNLWKKCVDDNLEYMIIMEDDVNVRDINKDDTEFIENTLKKENSIFISPSTINYLKNKWASFYGTHFYIISNGACKQLLKHPYPIDVQVDSYMSNLVYRNLIHAEFKYIYNQTMHSSTIQELCIKCFLPTSPVFYIIFVAIISLSIYYYYNRSRVCETVLEKYNF